MPSKLSEYPSRPFPAAPAPRFRVHVAPLGFEVDRLTRPAISLYAEVVVILTSSATDRSKASDALELIRREFKESRIKVELVRTDLWDTPIVVNEVGGILQSAPHHEYFFNISTGPKPACIAGTLAADFWGIQAYYQPVDYEKPGANKVDYAVKGRPQFLTRFATPTPDTQAMRALQYLVTRAEPTAKKDLLNHLKETGVIRAQAGAKAEKQSHYGQLDTILGRLEGWGFVQSSGRRKGLRLEVSQAGKGGFKMFHHLVHPRDPLTSLLA